MPRKSYAPVMADINRKLSESGEEKTEKPIYRIRIIFPDTTFLKEAARRTAQEEKSPTEGLPESDRELRKRVMNALRNPLFKWRSIEGISKETGIRPEKVKEFIDTAKAEIVQSVIPSEHGEKLYTTPDHWQEKASFWDEFRSIIRNPLG